MRWQRCLVRVEPPSGLLTGGLLTGGLLTGGLHGRGGCERRSLGTRDRYAETLVMSGAAMGVIRKTLSIGTLGAVSFRSNKEKLRRAERSRSDAESSLSDEHAARVAAEARISAAEKRVHNATAAAARAASRLDESKRRRRRDRRARAAKLLAEVQPIVHSGAESVRSASSDAAERGRKAGRRAGKSTKRSLRQAKDAVVQMTHEQS
jgi:hypothetical protein